MKIRLLLCCCCLLCGCRSLKKINKSNSLKDSVLVLEKREQEEKRSQVEMQQMLNSKWDEQQVLEIDAEAPYRLHPDSGLIGGAGYIKIKLSGSRKTNHQLFNSMQANHLKEVEQQKEEKIKVKQVA